MSILKKVRTALNILKTRGLNGIIQTIRAKLDRSFRPDEIAIVYDLLKKENYQGFMIDVGAHHGQSLKPFAEDKWRVLAFEPDSKNRAILFENFGSLDNVIIDPRACAEQEISAAPLFTSDESTGVSGLSAFLNTHEATENVIVTTLRATLKDLGLMHLPVDFLKIDTEGFDLMVLKGFPWEDAAHPEVILTEFEDIKTKPLGYDFYDLAEILMAKSYQLVISEWHPIKHYGGQHQWRRFAKYPCQLANPLSWGNIIAVKNSVLFDYLCLACQLKTT